ncbi:MAG: helix-hairpin-helix domain-containing protein [Desulfobulbaceae bacterium]|nr:helix-hairpin-helix domain-containing protein [Desulfobulbaceae bacterium]
MKTILTTILMLLLSTAIAFAGTININTATSTELEQLPGIGASKAEAIVKYRETHGLFKRINDITNVKGIGVKLLEKIREDIVLGGK